MADLVEEKDEVDENEASVSWIASANSRLFQGETSRLQGSETNGFRRTWCDVPK
jgi:hypothetical protein